LQPVSGCPYLPIEFPRPLRDNCPGKSLIQSFLCASCCGQRDRRLRLRIVTQAVKRLQSVSPNEMEDSAWRCRRASPGLAYFTSLASWHKLTPGSQLSLSGAGWWPSLSFAAVSVQGSLGFAIQYFTPISNKRYLPQQTVVDRFRSVCSGIFPSRYHHTRDPPIHRAASSDLDSEGPKSMVSERLFIARRKEIRRSSGAAHFGDQCDPLRS